MDNALEVQATCSAGHKDHWDPEPCSQGAHRLQTTTYSREFHKEISMNGILKGLLEFTVGLISDSGQPGRLLEGGVSD